MLRFALTILLAVPAIAQIIPGLAIPPSGNNQKASVTQYIGPVRITIDYSSPSVHAPNGTDRRGQISGKFVPYGLTGGVVSSKNCLSRLCRRVGVPPASSDP